MFPQPKRSLQVGTLIDRPLSGACYSIWLADWLQIHLEETQPFLQVHPVLPNALKTRYKYGEYARGSNDIFFIFFK